MLDDKELYRNRRMLSDTGFDGVSGEVTEWSSGAGTTHVDAYLEICDGSDRVHLSFDSDEKGLARLASFRESVNAFCDAAEAALRDER